MKTNGKFIIQATGPLLNYRLGLLKEVCPAAKDFLLVLTNRFSYEQCFQKYHDFFEFIIMDDYRLNHPISIENEVFPEFKTEQEFLEKITSFYGNTTGKFYPYDIHRFIFPYLIEKEILNFTITDSDFIFYDDYNLLNEFFIKIPSGTLYGPWHGEDNLKEYRLKFWSELQPQFPEIKLDSPFLRTCDGWMRGFHFRNLEEMKLLYNIWNSAIDHVFIKKDVPPMYGHGSVIICQSEWIISHIMQFYEHNFNYNFIDCYNIMMVDNKNIGRHYTRVEDTIYTGPRECWNYLGFDYSDTSTISAFIKNNKSQLEGYYAGTFRDIHVTDDFVFTKI